MSNPYRARPARSNIDHSKATGFGTQNQNVWGSMPRPQPNILPPSNTMQQHHTPLMNQPKQMNDSWEWDTNNGNDSWNWSVDQQPEVPPQQQQQQPQQQHFVPTYTNQGQPLANPIQDQYYTNVNGNKPDPLNQHTLSGENTPHRGASRESTPHTADSFVPYTNYNQNQQYPVPPRPNSNKSQQGVHGSNQWPVDGHPVQNISFQSSKSLPPPPLPPENPLQKDPISQTPPVPTHNTYDWSESDQANLPPAANDPYNWNKFDQQHIPTQYNWQNQDEASQTWQNVNPTKQKVPDDHRNQWLQQSSPPPPQAFHHTESKEHEKHSLNESSNWHNQESQWHTENTISQQQQPVQMYKSDSGFHSWSQPSTTNIPQGNIQSESHPNQWLQRPKGDNTVYDDMLQDNNGAGSIANNWQASHFSAPPTTSLSESNINAFSNTEHDDRKKSSIPSVPMIPSPVLQDTSNNKTSTSTSAIQLDQQNRIVENSRIYKNSENIEDNNEFNSHTNTESNSTDSLAAGFSQINLGKQHKNLENQSSEEQSISLTEEWSSQTNSSFNISNVQNNSTPDNSFVNYSDNLHSIEGHSIITQNQTISDTTYQNNTPKPIEVTSQSGYDQWYNQNAVPPTSTLENNATWPSKDRPRPSKQWTSEQNVENYENIQQPTEFVNSEVVAPTLQERDIYGSRDSINKETLDNDPKPTTTSSKELSNVREFRQEVNNVEVPFVQTMRPHQPPQPQQDQMPDNYEFASNDRNTFLETGELTDAHLEHEPTPPSQDDENDEVPNDIPFLREVPGQSSSTDQYAQPTQRLSDPRRNDPSGQEQSIPTARNLPDRTERRDLPPGQERHVPQLSRDLDSLERRNDPSGRERSLPPQQSRNDPSGEERIQSQSQMILEPSEIREVPGRGNEPEEPIQQPDNNAVRQILGGASSTDITQVSDDRNNGRVVTGSQEVSPSLTTLQDQGNESRKKREEAVGASVGEDQTMSGSQNRRDSYVDEDDDVVSGHSREGSRERRRDITPERRRYEYDRKNSYYDRDREYDDDYYYDRRRGGDTDRSYSHRDDFDRRDVSYRDEDRKHSRDDLDRHVREDIDRRGRNKDDLDERDSGRRRPESDRRRERVDDPRRRETRDYDPRYPRDRDYLDRDRRRGDDRRSRRYDDYDSRDPYRRDPYYDDPYSRSSRPSSRSSYNDRDREYLIRSRDPYYNYNGGYGGYDYSAHYGNNYYAYLENLRRTNPAAYSEWYHKYYANQHQQTARTASNFQEDRASVHSGRSSCEERMTGDKRTFTDMSLLEDSTSASARMTPTKYSTSHAYGFFSVGSLVHVLPSYPADGERAKVDILRVDNLLLHDPVARELRAYPGPLIKGVTHKKTIIDYCENKIKKAANNEEMIDRASYILLYELMIMLIQQNGNVVGVDIAALLLRNKDAYAYDKTKEYQDKKRRESVISQRSSVTGSDGNNQETSTNFEKVENPKQCKTVEQMTDEFRNTLLYGLVQEGLEYAMNEGLWGHALFLASKLDKRTHASVMTRFANSLPHHDPLQTLYQLHSGRVPAIVTCVADPRWDDWRPHLAMIISNTYHSNPEINRRSITTLGDTLFARGDIHAAHFCYILAQVDFGAYGANGVKLVLIGSNHHKSYGEFLTTEAIMLTEIYEYARNLSEPGFTLVDLQKFKFDLATKMVDCGLIEKALLYIEQIAVNIVNAPSKYKKYFIEAVYALGDRIKYNDPICKDATEDVANLVWLSNLSKVVSKYQAGEIIEESGYSQQQGETELHNQSMQNVEPHDTNQQQQDQKQWQANQLDYMEQPVSMMEIPTPQSQSEWQPSSLPPNMSNTYDPSIVQYGGNNEDGNQFQQTQQDYPQTYYQPNYGNNSSLSNWQQTSTPMPYSPEQTDADTSQQDTWNYESTQPTISMGPSSGKQYDPLEELDALETPRQTTKSTTDPKKTSDKPNEKRPTNAGGGSWFGGLFSKLAPKPKNQMILPDDNNPTIVWDPVAKKWMNKDEDTNGGPTTLAPPPKASDMGFQTVPPMESHAPPPPIQTNIQSTEPLPMNGSKPVGGNNMFKLQKGRNMRSNYIDVMNPSGAKANVTPANISSTATSMAPIATSSPQMFIPAPVTDPSAPVDFLTPTSMIPAAPHSGDNNPQGGPTMFNPPETKDRSTKNVTHNRFPTR